MNQQFMSLLKLMNSRKASDLHLITGQPLYLRINGSLHVLTNTGYTNDEIEAMLRSVASEDQWRDFIAKGDIDFSISVPQQDDEHLRFRLNLYRERGNLALAIRRFESRIPPFWELGLPDNLPDLITRDGGLILVTGPTGSGKTTTVAAMIDWLNRNRCLHIITIEDPIEYYHVSRQSLISQREVGVDTESFEVALRQALRQDPDVIVVGEMRDYESTRLALTAAETGHLVFATLHSRNAKQTINRIVDIFPAEFQDQVRMQLSMSLIAILSQRLFLSRRTQKNVLALEIMINKQQIRNNIRRNEIQQLESYMENDRDMQTMNQAIAHLFQQKHIDEDTLYQFMDMQEYHRHASRFNSMAIRREK